MRSSDHRKKRKTFKVKTLSPLSQSRFRIIFVLLCLGLGGLFLRVGWLQLFQSDQLRALAREVQTEQKNPLGTRRSILDRNGKIVKKSDNLENLIKRVEWTRLKLVK